tara:strand:- start:10848 stop:13457 length:2610 start_codon:yes stop_codon:yes gene_type:complete
MELYLPHLERVSNDEGTLQYFLSRVLAPQLNKDEGIRNFFNQYYDDKFERARGKVLGLHPKFKTSLERNIIPAKSNSEVKDSYAKSQEQKQKYVDYMLKIKPEQQAAMSPHVQISILPRKKNGQFVPYKDRKIISFDKKTTLSGYGAMDEYGKGDGAGVTNVSVEKKYATANMFDPGIINISYFFQSYQVFADKVASPLKWHGLSHENPELRFTELIRPNGFRENHGCLILEYGWNAADSISDDIINRDMKEIINDEEKKIYVMGYKSHSFDFHDDASITLKVTYFGVGRESLRDSGALITSFGNKSIRELILNDLTEMAAADSSIADKLNLVKRVNNSEKCLKLIAAGKKCVNPPIQACGHDENCKKTKRTEQLNVIANAKKALSRDYHKYFPVLFEKVLEDNLGVYEGKYKVTYSFDSEKKNLKTATVGFDVKYVGFEDAEPLSTTITYNVEEITKTLKEKIDKDPPVGDTLVSTSGEEALPKEIGKILRTPLGAFKSGGEKTFRFTTIRDIIMAIYRICDDDIKVNGGINDGGDVIKNVLPYILLGNTIIPLPDGQKYWYNLGDIFVEMKILTHYMKKTLKNNKSLSAGTFITLLLRDVLAAVLYEGVDAAHQIPINTQVYGYDGSIGSEDSLKIIQGDEDILKNRFALTINNTAANRLVHYHAGPNSFYTNTDLFLPKSTTLFGKDVFNKTRNLDLGYYRVLIGAAQGLVKKVSFSATDNPYYQTLLILLNSFETNWLFAPYFYSATLDTFGNNIYQFAGIFNIPAANLGIEKEKDFGLAGFYIIKSVTDTITPNSYTTSITGDRICNLADIENNVQAKKEGKKDYLANVTFGTTADVTLVKQLFNYLSAEKTNIKKYGVKIKKS